MSQSLGTLLARLLLEYLPIQQGLKPSCPSFQKAGCKSFRISSNTTRIETYQKKLLTIYLDNLLEYLPIQQGLKRNSRPALRNRRFLLEYLPIQQGLKLLATTKPEKLISLLEYLPIQQGLKLISLCLCNYSNRSFRISSNTTRIENS